MNHPRYEKELKHAETTRDINPKVENAHLLQKKTGWILGGSALPEEASHTAIDEPTVCSGVMTLAMGG